MKPLWRVMAITRKSHPLHPGYTVESLDSIMDPRDGLGPMPYALFTEGLPQEEATLICAELNRVRAEPLNMVPRRARRDRGDKPA